VAVLAAGELITRGVSWRFVVGVIGVAAAGLGLMFLILGREEYRRERERFSPGSATATLRHTREILREPAFWLFALAIACGGGAEGAFTYWSATYIQLNFDTVARAGGIGTAVFASGMVSGRLAFGRFVHQKGLPVLILVSAVGGAVISLVAFFMNNMIGFFLVLFAAGVSIACFWPSIQSHAAAVMRVDSTMLFILLSVAGIPGFGFTSWIMGIIAQVSNLRVSLLVVPGLLTILAAVMFADRATGGFHADATRRRNRN
jgi:fucose permease